MRRIVPTRPRIRPSLEQLESRCNLSTWANPWPLPQAMSISFVPDGTKVGAYTSDLQATAEATWGPEWQREILRAFQTWAAQTGINIGLREDGGQPLGTAGYSVASPRFGDIRVAAHPMSPDVIAYSIPFSASAGTWAGDLILNSAYAWEGAGGPPVDLYSIALHEAGNLLGIPDSDDRDSPLFDSYIGERQGLTPGDVLDIQDLYGARQPDFFEYGSPAGNATPATATRLTIGPWGPAEAVLADLRAGDVDVYRVTAPAGADRLRVSLVASGLSLLTGRLTVTDADGRVVGHAITTDPREGNVSVVVDGPVAGRDYYVEVRGARGDAFDVGSYALVVDAADWTERALDRLFLKVIGPSFFLPGLEAGLPTTAEDWAPLTRLLYTPPPQGFPAGYTAELDAALDGFLASLGGQPFDSEAFSRFLGQVFACHYFTLVEPGMMAAIVQGLKERDVLVDLIRDAWGRFDLDDAFRTELNQGALDAFFYGLDPSTELPDLVHRLWSSEAVRGEILSLIESGSLDELVSAFVGSDEVRELVGDMLPTARATPTDPAALRRLAVELLSGLDDSGSAGELNRAVVGALTNSEALYRRLRDLMESGALDPLAQAILGSDAAGELAQAVLTSGIEGNPAIMTALYEATLPPPNSAFETAWELYPGFSPLGNKSNFLGAWVTLNDANPVSISRVTVPQSTGEAPESLVVSALGPPICAVRPMIRVYDADRRPVEAEVLDSRAGIYLVQIRRPIPGQTYFLEVSQTRGPDVAGPVVYLLSAHFDDHLIELDTVASGSAGAPGQPSRAAYQAPEDQLVHWVLSARAGDGSAQVGGTVSLKVVDPTGAVLHTAKVRPGQSIGMALHLAPGAYTLLFEATSDDGSPAAGLEFELRGETLSDSINPYREDPSLSPVGGVTPTPPVTPMNPKPTDPMRPGVPSGETGILPPTTGPGASSPVVGSETPDADSEADAPPAEDGSAAPAGRIATLGPLSAPYMSSFGAEGPAEAGSLRIARGALGAQAQGLARGGAAFGQSETPTAAHMARSQGPNGGRSPTSSAGAKARPTPAPGPPAAEPPGAAPDSRPVRIAAGSSGGASGQAAGPVSQIASADPAASDLLASVSTFGPFSGLEELIEDHAAEILLSVGLVTGGIAYAAGRGGARGLSHPGSSIPRKWLRARDPLAQDARRARPNEADPGALPQRVLLITASARWGSRPLLRRWLEEGGVTVHEASESDWETGLIARPDLILLEHDPRTLDGLSLLRRIADAPPGRRSTPVLIFTASEDWAEETARGLELGAIDALIGPITPPELLARVRRAIRLRRRLEDLERGATSDSLTGLANRAAFEGRLAREWDECRRLGRSVALAVADLDHFKRINDTCGHPSGDEVLRRVAWALAAEVGASGSVARYGGEEFVILLPGCDRPGSLAIAERIRRRVGGLGVDDLRLPSPRITISVGVAWTDAPSQIAPHEMLNRADQALYEAKAAGRDLARIWGGMPEETTCVAPW